MKINTNISILKHIYKVNKDLDSIKSLFNDANMIYKTDWLQNVDIKKLKREFNQACKI